jgi:IS30 family transposase
MTATQPAETARTRRVTEEQREKIRELGPALRQTEIAQKLGCSPSTVGKVLRRFKAPCETEGIIIIRPNKAMIQMARLRSLSLSAYLLQLVDTDVAGLRLSQLPPVHTANSGVEHESHSAKRAR